MVRPQVKLHWKGQVLLPGLFDADHHITLMLEGGGTMVRQEEIFSGLLVGRLTRSVLDSTRENFKAMDAALKICAEAMVQRSPSVAPDAIPSTAAIGVDPLV